MSNTKDIAEKTLLDENDVFADVLNVLVFGGEEVIKEDELENAPALSAFKADDGLHQQERDVAKFWRKQGVRIALCGFENQTAPDADMPLRVISYDGASYKEQVLQHIAARNSRGRTKPMPVYPVATIVLYFGEHPWNKAKTLYECFQEEIHPKLRPYVHDYAANVFEIASLEREVIDRFKSDFYIVADMFWQLKHNKDYVPSNTVMKHVDKVLKFMEVMSGDIRYTDIDIRAFIEKGEPTMCRFFDQAEDKGRAEGENRLSALINKLLEGKLFDEIAKVTTDENYRNSMYTKYNL